MLGTYFEFRTDLVRSAAKVTVADSLVKIKVGNM